MNNKKYAIEWIELAQQHLKAAETLNKYNESKIITSIELQQAIEKFLKAIIAYYKNNIPRTHDLIELYEYVKQYIRLNEEEQNYLDQATDYFTENRYPGPYYSVPDQKEIKEIINFAKSLQKRVQKIVD